MVALSDVNNVIAESYAYDVFGAPTIYDANYTEISPSAVGNPYMFTARRADDETALYYYRARYYAFDIGRFLQTDPIGYADGINWYAYCGNNPIVSIDPSGENIFGGFVSWIAGNGFDTSYDMGIREYAQLRTADIEGGVRGGAAWADGAIPFYDPFKKVYANSDGSVDGVYMFSRAMGHVSRDALAAAGFMSLPKMNVAWGQWRGQTHFAYGTEGTALNALGRLGRMRVWQLTAADPWVATGGLTLRIISSRAVLATEGAVAYNCWRAVLSAWIKGGGAHVAASVIGYIGHSSYEWIQQFSSWSCKR